MASTDGMEKVDAWLKDWFPDTSFTKQDIRDICRGPMKGIFQDFLVPRFRTEDYTYVIRSNLYAHGQRSALPTPPGLDMEEQKLRREVEDVELEKSAALTNLLEKSEKLREHQDEQRQEDHNMDAMGFKRRHAARLKEMISCSNALLEDLKPLVVTDDVVYMEKEKHYESFSTIQEEAISLFQSMFFDGGTTDSNQLVEKNNKIRRLIEQVVRGGLSSKEIVRWHKNELDEAKKIVTETKNQFGNSDSSPLEELAREAEGLKQYLTTQHLNLYNKNVELANQVEQATDAKQKAQMDVIKDHFGTFAPVDFLKFLRKEELKSKLKKCQEISEQSVRLEPRANGYGKSARISLNNRAETGLQVPNGADDIVTQEKLEDITSGILRNWPATKSKLVNVAKKGREIIPDQFISALKDEGKNTVKNPPTNCYLHNISESEGISSYSSIEPQESYNESSLVALNPNSENWCLESFVHKYSEQQGRQDDLQDLTNIFQQLERNGAKAGSANLEILEHLIKDAKTNLNRFSPP